MKTKNYPRMHVSLYVSDIKKTVNFYSAFFGQEAIKLKSDYAKFILDSPSLIISFVENKDKRNSNFGHLGFEVASKEILLDKLKEAKEKGLPLVEEMNTSCCYAVQDKFWLADPDGHQWEVYYFHKDSDFNDPRNLIEEEAACCTPGNGCC